MVLSAENKILRGGCSQEVLAAASAAAGGDVATPRVRRGRRPSQSPQTSSPKRRPRRSQAGGRSSPRFSNISEVGGRPSEGISLSYLDDESDLLESFSILPETEPQPPKPTPSCVPALALPAREPKPEPTGRPGESKPPRVPGLALPAAGEKPNTAAPLGLALPVQGEKSNGQGMALPSPRGGRPDAGVGGPAEGMALPSPRGARPDAGVGRPAEGMALPSPRGARPDAGVGGAAGVVPPVRTGEAVDGALPSPRGQSAPRVPTLEAQTPDPAADGPLPSPRGRGASLPPTAPLPSPRGARPPSRPPLAEAAVARPPAAPEQQGPPARGGASPRPPPTPRRVPGAAAAPPAGHPVGDAGEAPSSDSSGSLGGVSPTDSEDNTGGSSQEKSRSKFPAEEVVSARGSAGLLSVGIEAKPAVALPPAPPAVPRLNLAKPSDCAADPGTASPPSGAGSPPAPAEPAARGAPAATGPRLTTPRPGSPRTVPPAERSVSPRGLAHSWQPPSTEHVGSPRVVGVRPTWTRAGSAARVPLVGLGKVDRATGGITPPGPVAGSAANSVRRGGVATARPADATTPRAHSHVRPVELARGRAAPASRQWAPPASTPRGPCGMSPRVVSAPRSSRRGPTPPAMPTSPVKVIQRAAPESYGGNSSRGKPPTLLRSTPTPRGREDDCLTHFRAASPHDSQFARQISPVLAASPRRFCNYGSGLIGDRRTTMDGEEEIPSGVTLRRGRRR